MQNQGHGAGASQATQPVKPVETIIGGYRYEFVVDPPDYVRCTICRLPSRDPYLTDCCGNVFCNSCMQTSIQEKAAKSGNTNGCPNPRCPNPRGLKMFRNKQIERTVNDLKVYCTNRSKGCGWQDKVGEITVHLARNCQFEDVECTNKCGQMIQRQQLSRHISNECQARIVKCKYCRSEGQYIVILGEHKETCPKYPVTCPNNCKVSDLLQENLASHREKCPLEIVECEYYSEGCTAKLFRHNMAKHNKENMDKHFTLIKCELGKAKKKEKDVQDVTAIKQDLSQKLDGIKQDLTIKLDVEMSHVRRELLAIRNDLAKTHGHHNGTIMKANGPMTAPGIMTSTGLMTTTGPMMTTSLMTSNGPKSPTRRHW